MGIFNTFRKRFFKGNATAKYLGYAIGEIILVVIGILIAVSINKFNEAKRENNLLTRYLENYRNDIRIDSAVIATNIELLDDRKAAYDVILSDTLDADYVRTNNIGVIYSYNPFKLQNKGYNQLRSHTSENNKEVDSLVSTILANHASFEELFNVTLDRIGNDIDANLNYLKENKPWLSDMLTGKSSPEIINYFLSKDYKNRTAIHQIYVYGNLYSFMKGYQTYMDTISKDLDKRLE